MRDLLSTIRMSIIAGSALFVAACGGGESAVNETVANDVESNLLLDAPGNDASALESIEPIETAPPAAEPVDAQVTGETTAVDSGGNTVDSDVAGM